MTKKKKEDANCINCGKLTSLTRGKCMRCYQYDYVRNLHDKSIIKSGKCSECDEDISINSYTGKCRYCNRNPNRERSPTYALPKMLKERIVVSPNDRANIKLLLVRFKHGLETPVDYYKVIDLFVSINGECVVLDTYPIDRQIVKMLGYFKRFIDDNTLVVDKERLRKEYQIRYRKMKREQNVNNRK